MLFQMEDGMICITDRRLPENILDSLRSAEANVVLLSPDPSLPGPTASHTDLNLFISDEVLIARREYENTFGIPGYLANLTGRRLILSDIPAGNVYPGDVGFCVCNAGRYLICRKDVTDPLILFEAVKHGMKIVNVRQGYAGCSCAVTADGSIITADPGVLRAFRDAGGDGLLIRPGHIVLPGYDTGFIGGCSGLCGGTLFFAGDISTHPDGDKIRKFCAEHSTEVESLGDVGTPLFDCGKLIFL